MDYDIHDSQSLEIRLKQWLTGHISMNGSKVLNYLMSHPNEKLHVSFLDWCTAKDRWPELTEEAVKGFEAQPHIPQTDLKALREYRREASTLIKKIQGAVELGDEKLELRLKTEYDSLMKHIRQVTTPRGRIKSFDPYWKKAYQRVFTCTRKTLNKLTSQDEELAEYVLGHLTTGQQFCWSDPSLQPGLLTISLCWDEELEKYDWVD